MDFEADTPTPEAAPESAASTYAATPPDVVSALGAQYAEGPAMALGRAAQRGAYADASALDQSFGAGGTADTPAGDQLIHQPLIPADEVNRQFAPLGPDGKQVSITDRPMSAGLAQVIAKQKQDELDRNAMWARYAGNHNALTNFAVGSVAFMMDPLNLGSLFVPGVGEEALLARAGQVGLKGVAARTAARLGAGATAGAAQMAPITALKYGLGTEEASDYDLRAAMKDMAFGAGFGAVAHAGFGGLREAGILKPDELMRGHGSTDMGSQPDLGPQPTSIVDPGNLAAVQNATLDQRQAAMSAGVAQMVDGREVDVSPIIPSREPDPSREPLTIPPGISGDLSRRAVALSEDGGAIPSQALEEAAIQRAPEAIRNALFGEPAQTGGTNASYDGRPTGPLTGQEGQPADAGQRLRSPIEAGGSAAGGAADAAGGSGTTGSRAFYSRGSVRVRHELADAADLITSHDAHFGINPAFPAELQPRDRAAAPARAQVNSIASNLQPERLGPSPEANFGTPIVGPDNVVESGNGRTMAIRQAYAANGDRAAAYRAYLESLGHDTRGFKEPILVARRLTEMTPEERANFAHATAGSEAQRLGTKETALSDARLITPDVSQHLRAGDVGTATNRDFARAFVSKLPPGEAAGMMAGDGSLSAAGVARLRAAVTARAYGDEAVIGRAFEHRDSNIKNIATALTNSAPDWIRMREAVDRGDIPASEDITGDVMRTAQTIMRARDDGERMSDVFRQHDMFADGLPQRVTRLFFKGDDFGRFYSAGVIGENLSTYARDLVAGAARGRDMFGNAAPGARDVLGGLIDRNRARADALEEGTPLLTANDVAQRQAQIAKDGYAPGIPQSDFDAVTERLYGPKVAEPTPNAAAEPRVDQKTGRTVDPEMAALESRVLSSPSLTDVDRAEIATANEGVVSAAARADAYSVAGDMLARGEGREPVEGFSGEDPQDVARRVIARVMPNASDDVVRASIRKIEDRSDWLGDMMRELIADAREDKPAPPQMEQSLEDALREMIAAAPPAERGAATLEDEMRKLVGDAEPRRPAPEGEPTSDHTIYRAGDISYADEAPEGAIDTSDLNYGGEGEHSFEGRTYNYGLDFTTEPYVHDEHLVHAVVSAITHEDEAGKTVASADHLTAVQLYKLKKSILDSLKDGTLDETAEQLTDRDRYSRLTPEQQRAEDEAHQAAFQASRDEELRARRERINSTVDDLVKTGWRPSVNRSGGWRRPDVLREFASPSSMDLIDARLRHHGIDIAGTARRAREAGHDEFLLANLRRTPEELTAATDQAAHDVAAMAQRGEDVAARAQAATERDAAAEPRPDVTLRNARTGAEVQAQDVATLGNMLHRFDSSHDASVDPLARATRMVMGDRLSKIIGDMKVYTVGPQEMRTLTASRLSIASGYEAAGFYDRAGHIVVLDDVARNPAEMSQLLMHEGAHAAFMKTIENRSPARLANE